MKTIRDSRLRGALGEITAQAVLTEMGFYVFKPIFEGGSVDLCAFKDDWLYRIQVKFVTLGCRNVKTPDSIRIDYGPKRFNKQAPFKGTSRYRNVDLYLLLLSNGDVLFVPNEVATGSKALGLNTTLRKALENKLDVFPEKTCGVYVGKDPVT